MTVAVEKLRDQAMLLSLQERAELTHALLRSLDATEICDVGEEYEAEIARRLESVRNGTASSRPAADVFADLEARLAR